MDSINVLVSLTKGYGLGDAVQMSAVLCHLRKHRPHWIIDFQAEPGRESVGYGIVHNTFTYGEPYPSSHYDAEVQIVLYDTFSNWHDRPNTRVTSCLHERFGIEWDKECARYEINIAQNVWNAAQQLFQPRTVAIHYQGDSDKCRKDLGDWQIKKVCDYLLAIDCIPMLIDWRGKSTLRGIKTTGVSEIWGRDAQMNCAIIAQCEAFVGIDSGPSKCASATDTPTLVTWTRHHPALFHDPAPNTTHLVPIDYHGLEPVCYDPGVIRFFEDNYNVRQYNNDPVVQIISWLTEVLL